MINSDMSSLDAYLPEKFLKDWFFYDTVSRFLKANYGGLEIIVPGFEEFTRDGGMRVYNIVINRRRSLPLKNKLESRGVFLEVVVVKPVGDLRGYIEFIPRSDRSFLRVSWANSTEWDFQNL